MTEMYACGTHENASQPKAFTENKPPNPELPKGLRSKGRTGAANTVVLRSMFARLTIIRHGLMKGRR